MKKLFVSLLATFMLLTGCSSSNTKTEEPQQSVSTALISGTYTGSAEGFHGPVAVSVTLSESKITSIEVTDSIETRFISDNAIKELPQDIIDNQSVLVDSYSGCTISSNALKNAVKNALTEAGVLDLFQNEVAKEESSDENLDTDVVVVGGGMAGLASSITAAENGSKVILVEKLDRVGGSTVESGGILYATGSSVNKDLDNDVDALVNYWQERAEGHADENMLKIAAEGSAVSVDKLQEWGVLFSNKVGTAGTSSAQRALYASNENANGEATDGVDFIVPLLNTAKEKGVQILTGVKAEELIVEDNVVSGITAKSDTKNYTIQAKSVILATGGYDLSNEMMKEHSPELAGTFAISSPGNTGDGIEMAEKVGAATNYYGGVIGFKIIDPTKHYIEGSNLLGWLGLLGVTDNGTRFGNEAADYPIFCTELINAEKEGANKFFLIFDSASELNVSLGEEAIAKSLGYKADTLEELGDVAGINSANLIDTVEKYNETFASGEADEFGKQISASVENGPFYAIEIKPATLGTIGGLLISENAEVLDAEDNPIANLYAAGEVANSQFFYKEYPASGSSISITTTFGRIAGQSASENANK